MTTHLPEPPACLNAVRARDAAADGSFVYAVLTTGVYCHPSCKARPARPENLRFFATGEAAQAAGYRPCKRCRPDLPPRAAREAQAVREACEAMAADAFDLQTHAASHGVSPLVFARAFRRLTGVSLAAYAAGRRASRAQAALAEGARVTDALYAAGFSSSGHFYAAADSILGMTPSRFRTGGQGEVLQVALGACALGRVLAAFSARGVCAILLGDADAALQAELARRFPAARIVPAGEEVAAHFAAVVALIAEPGGAPALPLDIRGTAFQQRVWQALRAIPPGASASYADIAKAIGAPGSARAVGAACAANPIAVAVPCHRVVTARGGLSGYAWGTARKAALRAREAEPG